MIHIFATPLSEDTAPALDVEWDDVSGTVSGPGADYLLRLATRESVPLHPLPGSHPLGASPLTSRTDMALMVGWRHRLPDSLRDSYPVRPPDEETDVDLIY